MDIRELRQSIEQVPALIFWFKIGLHDLQKTRLDSV